MRFDGNACVNTNYPNLEHPLNQLEVIREKNIKNL